MAFNRSKAADCEKCGHSTAEHYVPYKDINTSREAYECHCGCVRTIDEVPVPPGLIYVEGVGWDYASNAHKYKRSAIRTK